jgi:hypothetical protein
MSDTTELKQTRMREGFESQRKAGMNVDWFRWQIAWHDAMFTELDIAGAPTAPAEGALNIVRKELELIKGGAEMWEGWSGTVAACDRALAALLTPSPKPAVDALTTGAPEGEIVNTDELRRALKACVAVMLHNGVPVDEDHPARIALDMAEAALYAPADLRGPGTFSCPICGKGEPHQHSGEEVAKHRYEALREAAHPASEPKALTVTPAMVKAAMPWLANLHHMRKTDKESNVEEAIRAALALLADRGSEGK